MLFPRSLVLRTQNLVRFFVVFPLLFERLDELIRISAGFTLLFASLRTFTIGIIFLNHGLIVILDSTRFYDIGVVPRADRVNGDRRSDVRTSSHNRIHFIEGSFGQWDLTLA